MTAVAPGGVQRAARPDRGRRRRTGPGNNALIGHNKLLPYLFSAPAILIVGALLAYPVIWGAWQSFYRSETFGGPVRFVGTQNYVEMFRAPLFLDSLEKTAIFVTGCIVVSTVLGLVFAFALNRVVRRLRFLRAATIAPYIISNVAAAVMFRLLFNTEFGTINTVLRFFGMNDNIAWLATPSLAMGVVILAQVWTDLPLTILLLLAGLQAIDTSYLDAALVDGATGWRRAWHLSLPLISPQIILSIIWMSYSTLTGLGVVLALTGGGPLRATNTLPMEMYTVAFDALRFNEALAIATFLLVLNAVIASVFFGISRRFDLGN